MLFRQWYEANISNLPKAHLLKIFLILKFKIFVILEKYCQRFNLDGILLRLHIIMSHNINLFTLTPYFIVTRFLTHQPTLKLV